ncbi:BSD- domain containing protein [Leishmania donovani]|uniref:BSD_domain_containing_protein_putative/Pfam:PF039 09 n=1 Tax=Leishmania donovani TaxID=5661 RepID=A0A6J8F5X3_LEIDO|nr:BSD- domain containing protein [Leishmania donovani]VDZ41497.1 BSD_domain_containing_protein_putative/Pfam:PF03909 [Leishmania donovani]
MSSAEFVRNVDARTTIYRWEAAGLDELNRQNKLSSLPFWIPNSATRHHQFRVVLLRGLVQTATPASDPFGVLVELIAPPPPPVGTANVSAASAAVPSSSSSGDFPGGCSVTCEVLPIDSVTPTAAEEKQRGRDDGIDAAQRKAITSTKVTVLDANNAQVSFPDFISADVLHDTRYVRGSPKSFTLQITIETGISVPLHQAATTALAFFSSLTTSMGHLLGNTAQLGHGGRESIRSALLAPAVLWNGTASSPPATAPTKAAAWTAAALPPWEQPPEEWRDRAAEWHSLVRERLPRLGGTYRHGVEKTLSPDEVGLLAEVGLVEADLWALHSLFDFDRDVQEGLLASAEVRAHRYRLVPARLKEETFWANYFWKVHCVGQCVTERQVATVLVALCMPSRSVHANLSTPVEVPRHILDGEEAAAVVEDFVKRGEAAEPWCTVAAETARHCRNVLDTASQRADVAPNTRKQVESTLSSLEKVLLWYGNALEGPTGPPALSVGADAGAAAAAAAASSAPLQMEETQTPPREQQQREPSPTASPAATVPSAVETATQLPRDGTSGGLRSVSQVAFVKMPWEEEDDV